MARIKVVDMYLIEQQAQSEKKFRDKQTGQEVIIEAKKAGTRTLVIAEYDESILPFILPESFDSSRVKKGSVLHVDCPSLESFHHFQIKNVNRLIEAGK